MIDFDLVVGEIDKKIAQLQSLKFFPKREVQSKIICVPVNEFTDFYKYENLTYKTPQSNAKAGNSRAEVIEIDSPSDDDDCVEVEMNEKSQNVENNSMGKRRRSKNPRYNEEEFVLKSSSREFTNVIRGRVRNTSTVESLDVSSRDSFVSESSSNDKATYSEPTIEKSVSSSPKRILKYRKFTKPRKFARYGASLKQAFLNFHRPKQSSSPSKSGASKFMCKICDKSFSKGYSLTRHMFLHSGHRPHKCHICDFKFIQRSDLERHLTIHLEVSHFACSLCDLRFRTKKSLKNHEILHDDATPFKCQVADCGRKFRSNKTLRIHHLTTHSLVNYQCDFCGKFYTLKDYLKCHLKTHAVGGNYFEPRDESEANLHKQVVEERKMKKYPK